MTGSSRTPSLSPWFPPGVLPVRVGIYQVADEFPETRGYNWFSYWDGETFNYWASCGIQVAYAKRNHPTAVPAARWHWRGLARKP